MTIGTTNNLHILRLEWGPHEIDKGKWNNVYHTSEGTKEITFKTFTEAYNFNKELPKEYTFEQSTPSYP